MSDFPPLVVLARERARAAGFPLTRAEAGPNRASASLPGTGRFLATLAAACTAGRIAELGTGPGIGTAWIAGAMPVDCTLVTVEIDAELAVLAKELLAGDERVEVIVGDASEVLPGRGPFDLLFADCGVRTAADFAALVGLLRIGGQIVMDDLTPVRALPADSELRTDDPKRRLFGGEPRLLWTEVVFPDLENSLLVGTRVK